MGDETYEARFERKRDELAQHFREADGLAEAQRETVLAGVDRIARIFVAGAHLTDIMGAWDTPEVSPHALPASDEAIPPPAPERPVDRLEEDDFDWSGAGVDALEAAFGAVFGPTGLLVFGRFFGITQEQALFELGCREIDGTEGTTADYVGLLETAEPEIALLAPMLFMAPRVVDEPERDPLTAVVADEARWKPLRAAALLLLDHWGLHDPGEPGEKVREHLQEEADELVDHIRKHGRLLGLKL